jgi:hypothetical protein
MKSLTECLWFEVPHACHDARNTRIIQELARKSRALEG